VQTPEITAALSAGSFGPDMLRVLDRATELIPLARPGTVADVAGAVAYLAGPDAGFVTGRWSASTVAAAWADRARLASS